MEKPPVCPMTNFFTIRIMLLLLALPLCIYAQVDSIYKNDAAENIELIENFFENTNEDIEFDFNTVFEELHVFLKKPMNLNTATKDDLEALLLLSDIQIQQFLNYRQQLGDLISIHELQAVPGFDLNTIYRILPFVTVKSSIDDLHIGFRDLLLKGNNEMYLRWSRVLEEQRGYSKLKEGETASRYLGDPNRLYIRFRHFYENKLSYGFTAEKDPGEELFKGSNPHGFDFYSAHFFLKDYNKTIKAIALGDFSASFGQGLILFSGFGSGKSAIITNIKRNQRTIRPFTSVSETNFLRGAATTLRLGKRWELTALASWRGRDGNLIEQEDVEEDVAFLSFTSFQLSGLHRTPAEIADKNALRDFSSGGSLRFYNRQGHLAFNALHTRLDKTLQPSVRPYNQFYFSGNQLTNLSLDYSWIHRNINFFGETAMSDNGSIATLNGLLAGLDKKIDLSVLYRAFPKDYQALNPNPFAESTGARNENGLYTGIVFNPGHRWQFGGFFDIYNHPWLRFNADAPSSGYEYRVRASYTIKRKLNVYFEVRNEIKEINPPSNSDKIRSLVSSQLFQTKLNFSYILSKSLELRNRVQHGFYNDGVNESLYGFMVFQDVIFQPVNFPLSFTARYAIFDTEAYGIRFYTFENDVLYNYSIPSFYGKGTRFYINLRYRGIRNIVLEGRFAQTYFSDRDVIGSGLEEISGNTRTEIKFQAKLMF